MNGGRVKWLNEGTSRSPPSRPRVTPDATEWPKSTSGPARPAAPGRLKLAKGNRNLVDVRSPDEFTGKIIAPPGMTETAQRGGHIPGAKNIPWGRRSTGRHLQDRTTSCSAIYLRAKGRRSEQEHHRLLPHRRAFEPHLVRAQIPARLQEREAITTAAGPSTATWSACRSKRAELICPDADAQIRARRRSCGDRPLRGICLTQVSR